MRFLLNFILKSEWKRLSARLANSEVLRNFNEPYEHKEPTTWPEIENYDFVDAFRFNVFKKYMEIEDRKKPDVKADDLDNITNKKTINEVFHAVKPKTKTILTMSSTKN